MTIISYTARLSMDLLFPRRCPVCEDIVMPKGHNICPLCFHKLSFVRGPVCKRCGKEVSTMETEYCFDCGTHKRSFDWGRALINYDETARKSMAKIKYNNKREYLDFYGEAISLRYEKQLKAMKGDALVPVPVHPSRRRQRGFNQAEVLAAEIGRRLQIPVLPQLLIRNKKTLPQKELGPGERLKNLEQAFFAGQRPEWVKGVILVDDIYTTGSTIEACTRVLKKAGVVHVYFITICIGRGQ